MQTKAPKQKRWLRRWSVIACLLLVPICCVLITYVAGRLAGTMRLEQAFAEADRDDPGWHFDDLESKRRPFPPAEKNGIDQVLRVRAAVPQGLWPAWPFPRFKDDKPYLDEVRHAMDLSLDEGDRLAPVMLNAEQERVIRAEVARVAPAVELARQMPNYPYGRYPIKWTKDYFSTLLPHVQDARWVAALMNYDARLRARDSDLAGACHNVKAVLYASRAVNDEQTLASQLVRITVDGVAVKILERALACGRAPEPILADLQKELEQEAQTPFFLTGLRGERAALDDMLENVQRGVITFAEYRRIMTGAGILPRGSSGPSDVTIELNRLRGYLNLRAERAQLLHYMNESVELAKLPPWKNVDAIAAHDDAKNPAFIFASLLANVDKINLNAIGATAALRTAYTALAVERFHMAKARWPDKLDELVPEYLSAVPLDPFDGVPLRLARKSSAIIVYSVSMDRVDQGGVLLLNPTSPGSDLGFVLQDPAHRRQPGKPFQFPVRPAPPVEEPDPGPGDGKP